MTRLPRPVPDPATARAPADERRARDLLRALRLMGPNGEGFDAFLHGFRERAPHPEG
ncbi:hypothetical protein [Umezawaea sp.]|uniref:hypothetical protein n=1 Tax=Umezawaea sp. TaxID=1955258 RepID=UPI002ED32FE6